MFNGLMCTDALYYILGCVAKSQRFCFAQFNVVTQNEIGLTNHRKLKAVIV